MDSTGELPAGDLCRGVAESTRLHWIKATERHGVVLMRIKTPRRDDQ
jgi:hypothetical protein